MAQHVDAENMSFGREFTADWLAEPPGGRTA